MTAKILLIIVFIILFFPCIPAKSAENTSGSLDIVGGRLEPDNSDIYNKFIELSMKYRDKTREEVKIGIIPAGSGEPVSSAEIFKKNLMSYGVSEKNIETIPLAVKDDTSTDFDESRWKDNGNSTEIAVKIETYDGLWFTGGDQARYTEVLLDKEKKKTPVLEAVWNIYNRGAVLGGTSAGAAIMSSPMIGGGTSLEALNEYFSCKDEEKLVLSEGPGFFRYGMVDQHFSQRGRLGRLVVAALKTNNKFAFGIDENTAMVVDNRNNTIEVIGEGGLTIVNFTEVMLPGGGEQTGKSLCLPQGGFKLNEKLKVTEIEHIIISYIEKGDIYSPLTDKFDIKQTDDFDEEEYEDDKIYVSTSIFDDIKDSITVYLHKKETTKGLAFEMTGEEEGAGFLLTFGKGKDTKIYCCDEGCSALNVYMNIEPVKIEIKKNI
ncbi:MAG: cyanophycinase [Candidatus Eremiobacterota bacterium]